MVDLVLVLLLHLTSGAVASRLRTWAADNPRTREGATNPRTWAADALPWEADDRCSPEALLTWAEAPRPTSEAANRPSGAPESAVRAVWSSRR